MKLFIGNPTQQHREFSFWNPDTQHISPKLVERKIPPLSEVLVYEGSEEAVVGILLGHRQYNMPTLEEAKTSKDLVVQFYSDTPTSFDDLRMIESRNLQLLDNRSFDERKALAASVYDHNKDTFGDRAPSTLTMTLQEQSRRGEEAKETSVLKVQEH